MTTNLTAEQKISQRIRLNRDEYMNLSPERKMELEILYPELRPLKSR